MLNYIWMGLLIIGIGMALVTDISDQSTNKYQNGVKIPAKMKLISDDGNTKETSKVEVTFSKSAFNEIFN